MTPNEMRARLQIGWPSRLLNKSRRRHSPVSSPAVRCRGCQSDVVFVFTGQGAQWWAMGQQLIEREPIFRATLESVDSAFVPWVGTR